MLGPKKPPRLPSELIQAMPAAAAVPVRNMDGIDQNGPILVQTGPGKGIGGFVAIAPGVFGNPVTLYTHSLGMSPDHSGKDEVGGPGSHKVGHACDGKGIDYIGVCFGP